MKECLRCYEIKPLSEFGANSRLADGKNIYCRKCARKAGASNSRAYAARHPELRRARHLRYKYGLTADRHAEMLSAQGGVCANPACDRSAADQGSELCVDHDHSCCAGSKSCGKCVRGLLCNRCNQALGCTLDDVDLLQGLVSYLLGSRDVVGSL